MGQTNGQTDGQQTVRWTLLCLLHEQCQQLDVAQLAWLKCEATTAEGEEEQATLPTCFESCSSQSLYKT